MRSFWSGLNGGLLIFSLIAWIGGVMIFASMLKDSMDSRQLVLLLFGCILLVLIIHSFWGMLVEMSKNVINYGERDNLARENKELRRLNRELTAKNTELTMLVEMSNKVISKDLIRSGEQDNLARENSSLIQKNKELKEELNQLYDELMETSTQLKVLNSQTSAQYMPLDNSGQELSELNCAGQNDNNGEKSDTRPWKCNHCGNFNPASSVICGSCGKKRSGQR